VTGWVEHVAALDHEVELVGGAIAASAGVARRPDRPTAAVDPESARKWRRDTTDIRFPNSLFV